MRIGGSYEGFTAFSDARPTRRAGARTGEAAAGSAARPTAEDEPQRLGAPAAADEAAAVEGEREDEREGERGEDGKRGVRKLGPTKLTAEQKTELAELQRRDAEVRAHEAAHSAAAGSLGGGASYKYETGPDGRSYAVGGEVSVQMSGGHTPEERIRNAAQVRAAALAPAEPSGQDRAVAAEAAAMEAAARAELAARAAGPEPTPAPRPHTDEAGAPEDTAEGTAATATAAAEPRERDPEDLIRTLEREQNNTRGGWRHLHANSGCGPCGMAVAAYRG